MKEMFFEHGIHITDIQEKQFEIYYELLFYWNKKVNLTAITEYEKVVKKHFIDSAFLVNSDCYSSGYSNSTLDLGTGAGFPGMVLAILRPNDNFTLLDSIAKKTDFLKIVKKELQLENVQIAQGRAEEYGQMEEFRNKYDFVVSRAVADLPILLEYCIPFVKKNGFFVSYKGPKYEEEILQASTALHELNAVFDFSTRYTIDSEQRFLLFIKNNDFTVSKYPRRTGKAKKKPLM